MLRCHPMEIDLQTGTTTGQQQWDWDRTHEHQCDPPSRAPPVSPIVRVNREALLYRRIIDLEAELRWNEERLHTVIKQYERLLAEKDERIEEPAQPSSVFSRVLNHSLLR